jgi:hypothetical protein
MSMQGAAWRRRHATEEQAQAVLAAIAAAVASVGRDPRSDRAVAELVRAGIMAAELRDAARAWAEEDFCRQMLFDAGAEHGRAQALAAVPAPPGRRPASAPRNPILNLVKGGLASAAAVLGLKALARGAAAHHIALTAATAALTGTAVVAGTVYVSAHHSAAGPSPVPVSAPAAGAGDSASPLLPSPSSPGRPGRVPKADADGSGSRDPVLSGPAWVPASAPAPPSPAPPSSPASALPSGPPSAGTLSADMPSADFGALTTVTITLTAAGGPVTWGAVCSDSADVSLSQVQGTLQDGESVTVTLTLSPAVLVSGSAVLTIYPGHLQIPVTWEPAPVVPAASDPSPSPSDS